MGVMCCINVLDGTIFNDAPDNDFPPALKQMYAYLFENPVVVNARTLFMLHAMEVAIL